ncbi:pseudouridine-5'-phosphate glycosidase [Mycoplasmatota bacterium]|nr:pseudouridine-5'-phosphate glycosidase [Mycoplasmatota bacterium]
MIEINETVSKALKEKKAVVALESTIISHGMPYPENVNMANTVEKIIKDEGAVPATIAIINGVIKVGLTQEELLYLAQAKDVVKVSKRDFGYVVSQGLTGATTVSATMLIAKMAGIKVFATGGIGGVHRGAQQTFDISRDLEELASQEVCVVCAGAKSILDLGLTKEFLETKGVELLGYQTKELPAFYTRESGFDVDYKMDTPEDIAKLMKVKWNLGLSGGMVVANPIPKAYAQAKDKMDLVINEAINKANELGVKGKDITPFLLDYIKTHTKGESLKANLELVYNNARLAAQIAIAYH